ncbi:MAG: TlpA disulfide reductase family protein [Bryobacteraceae bacterium]
MIRSATIALLIFGSCAFAQQPSGDEQQSLMSALTDGQSGPLDTIRALEAHLAKYPKSSQMNGIEKTLAKAALDSGDWDRLVKYGEALVEALPDDILLLDRLSFALISQGNKPMADRAYTYARHLENLLDSVKIEPGRDAARRQEDRDRALARTLLYQARARTITGEIDEAIRLSARAFSVFPSEEAARDWADSLNRAGKTDEAIIRLAEAFVVNDPRTTEAARLNDRILLGDLYMKKNGSEVGLGDVILAAYDRMTTVTETRRKKLIAMEPNAAAQNAMEFTISKLDGKPFRLESLKGKIVVMDFWATWCVPCRVQHPLYETLRERFPDSSGVVFLGINADEDKAIVEPFLEEQKWSKDVYFEDGLARQLNVMNIPATILFDKSGKLSSRMDGFDPGSFLEQMTLRIQSMLLAK